MPWPLPQQFRVRLTMLSDWHVGSGTGRPGNIDRLILRDHDKLPYVPAKTLRGIWRDACELLCRGLDNGQVGGWSRFVDHLFGSQPALGPHDPNGRHQDPAQEPLPSAVQIRPARIASPLRECLQSADPRLRQLLTFVKPGVAIDPRSGSAKTDFLRFEEMARVGTVLDAECAMQVPDSVREAVSALLIASAKLVERLGGKRRRGAGRCRLEILDNAGRPADERPAIEWLKQHPSAPDWPVETVQRLTPAVETPPAQDDDWVSVPLKLILRGPLAVAYRATGNVVESLDYLPGYYLLPFITETFPQLRAAVPSGDVVVLPAHPEIAGQRGEPVPLALYAPKEGKGLQEPEKVVNRLVAREPGGDQQLKQLRDGFLSPTQPTQYLKTPKTMLTHNSVFDEYQRPSEETGGVYSYEAIAPEVVLRSELRLRGGWAKQLAASEPNWYRKLSGIVSLGRSKKDDYGEVELHAEAPRESSGSTPELSGNQLFVWLVSDTLLRNEQVRLEPTPETLRQELSRRLGVPLRIRDSAAQGTLDALVRVRRLEPWHVGWGLPRPSLVALQAGSCVVFEVQQGTLDPAKLSKLEVSGIGDRTAEGFGQVRFNHPLLTQPFSQVAAKSSPIPQPVFTNSPPALLTPQDAGYEYARLIERECWKQEIRRACLRIAADRTLRQKLLGWTVSGREGKPPMSQLGGLRNQLARLRTAQDARAVLDWLHHLQQNPRRREKWPNGSLDRIESLLQNRGEIWQIILQSHNWPTLTKDATQQLQQELWPLAIRMFFDACIRAHKRELEEHQS
jgi:CRISPR-associated protein Csx10